MSGSSKYLVLTPILFGVVLIFAFMNYETWSHIQGPAKRAGKKTEIRMEVPPKAVSTAVPGETQSADSLGIIAGKNIFSPERKEFPPVAPTAEQAKAAARPQVILHGVAIAGDYKLATVSSPDRPLHQGERATITLKIGDRIGEYKLTGILPDRITITAGADSFDVLLYDSRNPHVRTGTAPMIASLPPVPESLAVGVQAEPSMPVPAEKPNLAQAQATRPLPYNKYTYQMLQSAPPDSNPSGVRRGRFHRPPVGLIPQEPTGN